MSPFNLFLTAATGDLQVREMAVLEAHEEGRFDIPPTGPNEFSVGRAEYLLDLSDRALEKLGWWLVDV